MSVSPSWGKSLRSRESYCPLALRACVDGGKWRRQIDFAQNAYSVFMLKMKAKFFFLGKPVNFKTSKEALLVSRYILHDQRMGLLVGNGQAKGYPLHYVGEPSLILGAPWKSHFQALL